MNKQPDKEIERLENEYYSLQRKLWRLQGIREKETQMDFLSSGIIRKFKWRIRTYGNDYRIFLQLDAKNDSVRDFEKIIPFPHSHWEFSKGITLNQDDGDITITFDKAGQIPYFIKNQKLTISSFGDLEKVIRHLSTYKRLHKMLRQ